MRESIDASLADALAARAALAGVDITPSATAQLIAYYQLLERWDRTINLTGMALADRADATIDRLLIEPLVAASRMEAGPITWLDFGSGGGSPAIPLKIVRAEARLTMVEAKSRKASFLREAVATLGFANTNVLTTRIEDLGGQVAEGSVDVITVRAVRISPQILGRSHDLLKLHGKLLSFQARGAFPVTVGFKLVDELDLHPSGGFLATLARLG